MPTFSFLQAHKGGSHKFRSSQRPNWSTTTTRLRRRPRRQHLPIRVKDSPRPPQYPQFLGPLISSRIGRQSSGLLLPPFFATASAKLLLRKGHKWHCFVPRESCSGQSFLLEWRAILGACMPPRPSHPSSSKNIRSDAACRLFSQTGRRVFLALEVKNEIQSLWQIISCALQ